MINSFCFRLAWLCALLALFCLPLKAQEPPSEVVYFAIEPDIVTNYVSKGTSRLGYVRVTIELMLFGAEDLVAAQHHAPLLRATVIDILGQQEEAKIKSLTGREEIRGQCLEKLQELMQQEIGARTVKDFIFTKYLYQG
jgi:flagellar FliL protein